MHEITEAVTSVIGDYGLYAVFLLMLVDAVLPAASELVMLYAGAVAVGAFPGHEVTLFGEQIDSTGWAYVAMALAGVVGYTLGSILGWAIGYFGGRPFLERHGRWVHVTPSRLARAEDWFRRYGDAAVFFSRVVPVVRSFISIPAGVVEMPIVRFTVLSFLGTLPWCFGLAGAGLALGSGWERFHESWRYADYAIVGLAIAAIAYLAYRLGRRRARRRTSERPQPESPQ
jgi:membrane protein DedA with SNARE-associated domain